MSIPVMINKLESYFKQLADVGKLAHGYILFGPGRAGKKNFAAAFARYLEEGKFSTAGGILSDAFQVSPDENGTLGIDRIREIKNFLWQKPNRSVYRTVILTGGEALTDEAQNAMLKIAEEPPASALIFLLIDDPERLRPTLQSRFQKIFFAREKGDMEDGTAEYADAAGRFLKAEGAKRLAAVKELVANEDFELDRFLEALILATPVKKNNFKFLHAVLELRRQINYFNLNPRLQLMALAEIAEHGT